MRDAAEFIRAGNGPVFVETQTYRYFGHSKSDRNLYRSKEEIDDWRDNKDPIARFRSQLIENTIFNEEAAEEINSEALAVIEAAVAFADASPEPDPTTVTEYVYA